MSRARRLRSRRAEEIGIHTAGLRFGLVDDSARREIDQRHIHRLHAVFLAGLHDPRDLMELGLTNEVPYCRRRDHDFQRRDAPAGFLLKQRLGDHSFQGFRKLCPDLRLLGRRKGVDDAVDRFGRARRVQGAEDQVSGFCGGQGELNGFQDPAFRPPARYPGLREAPTSGRLQRRVYARRVRVD